MGGRKGRKGRFPKGQDGQKAKPDQVEGAAGQTPDVTKLIFQLGSTSQDPQVPLSDIPDILINGQNVSEIKGKPTAPANIGPDALPSIAEEIKLDSEQQTTGDQMSVNDVIDDIKMEVVQEEKHSNQGPMERGDVIQDQANRIPIDPKSDPDRENSNLDQVPKISALIAEEVKDQEIKADQVSMATGDVPVYQGLAILTYPNSEPVDNANEYDYEGRMITVPTGLAVFAPVNDEVKVDPISLESADLVQNLIDATSEPDDNSLDKEPEISAPIGESTENVVKEVIETSFKSDDTVQNPIDPKSNVTNDPEPMSPKISDLLDEITDIVEVTETRGVKHETIADQASLETGDISQNQTVEIPIGPKSETDEKNDDNLDQAPEISDLIVKATDNVAESQEVKEEAKTEEVPLETGDVTQKQADTVPELKPKEESSDSIPSTVTKTASNEADVDNLEDKYLKPTEVMLAKSRPLKHQMPPSAAESFTFESARPNTGRAVDMTDAEVLSLLQFLHEAFNKMSARSSVYAELETVLHLGSVYESLDPIGRRYATRLLLKFYLGIADGWEFSDRVVEYHDWQQSVSTAKIFQNKPAGREENHRSGNKYRNPEGGYGRLPPRRDFRGREQYPLENQRNYPSNPNREPPGDYRHSYQPPQQRNNRPRGDYQRGIQHRDDYQRGNQQRGEGSRENGEEQRRAPPCIMVETDPAVPSALPDTATVLAAVLALRERPAGGELADAGGKPLGPASQAHGTGQHEPGAAPANLGGPQEGQEKAEKAQAGGAASQSGEPQVVGKGGAVGGGQSVRYVAQSSGRALERAKEAHSIGGALNAGDGAHSSGGTRDGATAAPSGGALNGGDGAHSGGGTLEGDMEAHSSGGALNNVGGQGREGDDGAHSSGGTLNNVGGRGRKGGDGAHASGGTLNNVGGRGREGGDGAHASGGTLNNVGGRGREGGDGAHASGGATVKGGARARGRGRGEGGDGVGDGGPRNDNGKEGSSGRNKKRYQKRPKGVERQPKEEGGQQ